MQGEELVWHQIASRLGSRVPVLKATMGSMEFVKWRHFLIWEQTERPADRREHYLAQIAKEVHNTRLPPGSQLIPTKDKLLTLHPVVVAESKPESAEEYAERSRRIHLSWLGVKDPRNVDG